MFTRNIVVQGDEGSEANGFGGHTLFRSGPVININGVEFTRMGQKWDIYLYSFVI